MSFFCSRKWQTSENKISIINKGVNNIDINQEVNEEKEKKRKRLEDYREKLEKFLNLFSDNNVVTTGNNIILNKEQSKVIDDFLFYLMIDIFSIKGKYSELYNKFYEFIQYLKYQKDLIKDDKVELSKEKIKEIKKIVSEELEEQKNQNISNQKEDTGLLVEHVNDNKQERDINQQKNKETHNIKDNNIEIENNNRNKDIKQEKQNIVLNNKKVKSLITMINNILKRNNQYISIQDTIKIIRALNCIDDIEQNLKDSLKKYIDNINNVLENARNNPVIDINSIKLNEIKELLETGINNKSTGKKVININNDMNNLKEQKELINRIKNNRLPEKQNDKNINTNGKKTLKKLNYNVVCTFEELKNLNNLNKLNKTYYQPTELIWIKKWKD